MYRMPGGYPELRWRDDLLVDGWAYLTDAKGLLCVKDYQVLSQVRAWWVLEEIYREDARLCDALLDAYAMGRCLYERDTLATLKDLLGFSPDPFVAEVNRLARLIVFERKPLKPTPPPEYQVKLFEPAPLSDKSSWVTIECVDDSEPPRPAPDISLEVITASAEVRTARTNQRGIAFVDGIAAGRVTIRVLGLDGSLWRAGDGDAAQPSPEDERFTWHEVKQGECLSRIARQYGFKYWQDIWKFRLNKALREKRKSPHVLYPGDMLAVPALQLHEILRESQQTHRIVVLPKRLRRGYVLATRDLRFHAHSAVLLAQASPARDPDVRSDAPAFDALASTLMHAREHPAQSLLLAGHSADAETPEGDRALSELRAASVRHMLRGERAAWVALVREHSCPQDLPAILRWCAEALGWPCAMVDEQDEARALLAFQKAYNRSHNARPSPKTECSARKPGAQSSTCTKSSSPQGSRPTRRDSRLYRARCGFAR